MTGARRGSRSRRRLVGIGSRGQEALEAFEIMELISESVVGLKWSNFDDDGESKESRGGQAMSTVDVSKTERDERIVEILVTKYSLNV